MFTFPIFAAINAAASVFPPVAAVSNVSSGVQALALGVSTIGALGGFYITWKHGHDMNGTLHKATEVVALGSLCLGIGTLFTMIGGASGAII